MPDETVNAACSDSHGEKHLKSILFTLFFTAFICAAVFLSPSGWLQVSHDDLTKSIVEDGSFKIDRFITDPESGKNTGDWSFYDGHYYSNKAPGTSFIGALAYLPVYHIEKAFHKDSPSEGTNASEEKTSTLESFHTWWINLFCSVLPFAFGCVLFFLTLRKLGCSVLRSGIFAEISALCTPLCPYATANWSHPLAAIALLGAFYSMLCADDAPSPSGRRKCLALSGFACGCAFLVDYGSGAALPVFVIAVCLQFRKKVIPFFLGALGPALVFCAYHSICFGSPFVIASFYNNPLFIDAEKAGGIFGHVSSFIMLKLLIGSERGIFWSAPVLLAAIPGLVAYWKRGTQFRKISVFLILWILAGLVANSAFNGWNGGATICARYLIFILPAFCIAAAGCPFDRPCQTIPMIALVALSWFNMLVINAVTPVYSVGYDPLYLEDYRRFFCDVQDIMITLSPGTVLGGRTFMDFCLMLLVALVFPIAFFREQLFKRMRDHIVSIRIPRLSVEQTVTLALLVAGAVVFIIYPLDIIWGNDQPNLLRNALYASQDGYWCRHGLIGSFGVGYGPFPTWIYQVLLMFSQNLLMVARIKTVLFLGVCLYLLYRLARECNLSLPVTFALFLISPWFRIYSRSLWDNMFLIPLSMAFLLALLVFLRTGRVFPLVCAAILATLGVSLHSMGAPLAGGVVLFFLLFKRDILKKRFFLCAACALPAAFFSGYIMISRYMGVPRITGNHFGGEYGLLERIADLFQFMTLPTCLRFCRYFIPGGLPGVDWLPSAFTAFGWIVFAVLFVPLLFSLRVICRKQDGNSSSALNLIRLSACILLAHLLFFGIIRIDMYPHYHQAAVMPYILIVAYGFTCLACKRNAMKYLLPMLAVPAFILFIVFAIALHRNAGTRDIASFGPTLEYQWDTAVLLNEKLSTGATVSLQYDSAAMPYDDFPQSLVIREFEDIVHPKGYPDFPESDPIPLLIAPPNPARFLHVQ